MEIRYFSLVYPCIMYFQLNVIFTLHHVYIYVCDHDHISKLRYNWM